MTELSFRILITGLNIWLVILDLEEMCSILVKNQFMLPIRMKRIKNVTELLIAEGMPGENIKNDLHIYKFSLEKIKERIDRAKEVGIKSLKPWIIRCPPESLDNIEEKKINKMNLLNPHGKLENYISSYFNCDRDLAEGLIKRDPSLLKINVKNLSKVLNFLHSKGYLFEEIFCHPRILHWSEKTLRDRYDKWFQCYAVHPPLKVLTSLTHTSQIHLKDENKIT
ncbi:GSCOCG00003871001-RA-CDS [Cotesia congregata]|nr:GSCOCG00003871001-RA-CDS [Cotesia congregata]